MAAMQEICVYSHAGNGHTARDLTTMLQALHEQCVQRGLSGIAVCSGEQLACLFEGAWADVTAALACWQENAQPTAWHCLHERDCAQRAYTQFDVRYAPPDKASCLTKLGAMRGEQAVIELLALHLSLPVAAADN